MLFQFRLDIIAALPQGYTWAFFIIALLSSLGYAIQGTLLAQYARLFDPFLVTSCRNLAFIFTLSPLLLLAPPGSLQSLAPHFPLLLLAAFFGALGVTFIYASQRAFPVGVVSGFQQMLQVWMLIFGYLFLQERIGILPAVAISIIMGGVLFLALQKSSLPHLNQVKPFHLFLVFLFPLLQALGFFLIAIIGRETNLLAAGYAWEFLIGVFAFAIFLIRKFLNKSPILSPKQKFRIKDAFWIAVIGTGTLFGTGGTMILYGLASPGVSQTVISALQIVIICLLAIWLYGEYLKKKQWLAMTVIVIGLILLKLATG